MATAVPTGAPTGSPTVDDDDDDSFVVNATIANLEWSDIWNVLVPSLAAAMALTAFWAWKFRKRSTFHLIYCPRYRWEREIATSSARAGGSYAALRRPKRQRAALLEWAALPFRVEDATLLRHVGLEMYVLLRFLRLSLRVAVFGCCIVAPICVAVYGTSDQRSGSSGYSRIAFYRFTLANVDTHNSGRLWTPAIMLWIVTLHAVLAVKAECAAFVELKQNFFTTAPVASNPYVAEQQLRSVMLERLPPALRTSERLLQHWSMLLPGRVHSATVCVDTRQLMPTLVERERLALELERLLLKKQRTEEEPLVGDERCCLGCCETPGCCLAASRRQKRGEPAIEVVRAELAAGNETYRRVREALVAANEERRASEATLDTSEPARPEQLSYVERLGRVFSGNGTAADARRALDESGLGDAARGTTNALVSAAQLAKRVTLGDRFCDTGFVTFTDCAAANMVRQMQLSDHPHGQQCFAGIPDARDIMWENIPESLDAQRARQGTGSLIVYVIAFYWSLYISFCYAVASYQTLKDFGLVPSFDSLSSSQQTVARYLQAVVPIGLVSLALALFPILLQWLAEHYEHRKLRSDVQLSVLDRNFFLQIINIWLTVVIGSVWSALKKILRHPAKFFKFIGTTLPIVSVYFMELIVIKTFISLFWELARIFPWLRLRAAKLAAGGALTARDHRDIRFLRPEMPYGSVYSTILMVVTFGLLFAVIAPLSYVFVTVYLIIAYLIYTHQALHVYVPMYDSGGIFFFPIYCYLLWALIASQATVFGFLLVKKAWLQAAATFLAPVGTYFFKNFLLDEYATPSERPSLQNILAHDADLARPDASTDGPRRLDDLLAHFDPTLFRQPELDEADVAPLPVTRQFTEDDEDAAYDDYGDDETKLDPNRATGVGINLQAPLVTSDPSYDTFASPQGVV